ncbi:hypothetical protein DVH24_029709 [Malus domestica]|uniref:SGNH hydrolase-type esterase domain-containing protein n=1 Tax=Malus domestica TaxID=3750 RepID=A0A498HTT3_MALDO|nr:hypothetical protein DVH24_029709 [Malus domestica]
MDQGCCGTENIEVSILCTRYSPGTCNDSSKYIFWDSYHPSEKGYEKFEPQFVNILFFHCNAAAVELPNNEKILAMIVFGHSIVDPGNNNISTVVKCNFQLMGGICRKKAY